MLHKHTTHTISLQIKRHQNNKSFNHGKAVILNKEYISFSGQKQSTDRYRVLMICTKCTGLLMIQQVFQWNMLEA